MRPPQGARYGRWVAITALGLLGLGAGGCLPALAGAAPAVAITQVEVGGETLRGLPDPAAAGVVVFKGLPFAAPPVGALRWAPPQPPQPRTGIRTATEFAPGCFQDSYNTDWYRRVGKAFGAPPALFQDPPFNEDCLYLNVWTPRLDAAARLPVMVWLHGGSNKAGWAYEPNYLGGRLAAAGPVVVVTVPYRLGIFGFFSHPELQAAGVSPNFGLQDQLAALQWVQANIAYFGGDPEQVTVFGESAGAKDIGYLMVSPAAKGLFKRAISQSGGFQLQDTATWATLANAGTLLGTAVAGAASAPPTTLQSLRDTSAAVVFAAAKTALPDHDYTPVVDGSTVLSTTPVAYAAAVPYDLLMGSNGAEDYMYESGDVAAFERYLQQWAPPTAAALRILAARESVLRLGHDRVKAFVDNVCPGYLLGAAVQRAGHSAWLYHFTRVRPGPGGQQLLAYHGAEIPYVFNTHDDWFSSDATEPLLTRTMMAYWVNFARSGNPNGQGLPAWPSYDPAAPQVQQLDAEPGAQSAPNHALCLQLAEHLYGS